MTDPAMQNVFQQATAYDRSINWNARLQRELPCLAEIIGPPGSGGILDAGCGTGRHAMALAQRGYRVTGADASTEMLSLARSLPVEPHAEVTWVNASYRELSSHAGGGFDGVFCIGNSLAAAASRSACAQAVEEFARCLRAGGRLFVQILNFPPMRGEHPCVRGPRVAEVDGVTRVSVRHFHFDGEGVIVVDTTVWCDEHDWRQHSRQGRLFPLEPEQLLADCVRAGLHVDDLWGSYRREPFDPLHSTDLLLAATRC